MDTFAVRRNRRRVVPSRATSSGKQLGEHAGYEHGQETDSGQDPWLNFRVSLIAGPIGRAKWAREMGLPFRTLATLTMTRRRPRFCAGLLTLHTNIQFAAWQPAGIGLGHKREVSNSDQLLLRD